MGYEFQAIRPSPSHMVSQRSYFLCFHRGIVPYSPVAFHRIAAIIAATVSSMYPPGSQTHCCHAISELQLPTFMLSACQQAVRVALAAGLHQMDCFREALGRIGNVRLRHRGSLPGACYSKSTSLHLSESPSFTGRHIYPGSTKPAINPVRDVDTMQVCVILVLHQR